jgi:PEP-CTERM motif
MSNTTLTLRFATITGVSLAAATSSASAAVVVSSSVGSGLALPTSAGVLNWDVDSNATFDFQIERSVSSLDVFGLINDQNGGRIFGNNSRADDRLLRLNLADTVGASVAGRGFLGAAQNFVAAWANNGLGSDAAAQGWTLNTPGYFGFRFTSGANTHYCWARMTISTGGFTINEAYYDDTPGQAIAVGALPIPEPASAAALLGLGAAGIAAWRRRRAA